MESKSITLTTSWVQISDGSSVVDLQSKGGSAVLIGIGATQPESTADAFVFTSSIKIMPPLIGWARTGNNNGASADVVVVSSAES